MVSAVCAVVLGLLLFIVTDSPFAGVGAAFAGGFGLPLWLLRHLRKRRIAKFIKELPNAVDVIVRGIRAGIPVGDCFRIVSREAEEPVRSEFRTVVETQTLGLSLGEAVSRLFERVPDRRGELLRDRDQHPAAVGRQPVGGAGQPLAGAARAREDGAARSRR